LPVIDNYGKHIPCVTIADCPDHKCGDRFVLKCINNKCYYLWAYINLKNNYICYNFLFHFYLD
jgi:hypothetical protein